MAKIEKQLTIAEALEQGYTRFCEDGGDQALHLSDALKDGGLPHPPTQQVYWLIDTNPTFYSISAQEICGAIESIPENQEDFGDEDGELMDVVGEVYDEHKKLFQKISDLLNEKYKKRKFFMPTNIQVI